MISSAFSKCIRARLDQGGAYFRQCRIGNDLARIGRDNSRLREALLAADRGGRWRRLHRYRAGCSSVAAPGRGDGRERRPPRVAGQTPAPTAVRPRSRRDRNTDRALLNRAHGYPAARPSPCRRQREKIFARQIEFSNGRYIVPKPRGRMTLIQRLDIVTPLLKRGEPLSRGPSESAYRRPAGKNCRSETSPRAARAAKCASPRKTNCGSRGPGTRAGCRLERHAPAAGLDTCRRPTRRRVVSLATPPMLWRSNSMGLRCTVSLNGSRIFRSRTILSAKSRNHGDFKPEAKILHLSAERFAVIEQNLVPHRQRMQAI